MPWSAVTYIAVPGGSAPASCSASRSTCPSWNRQASDVQPSACPVESSPAWYTMASARGSSRSAAAAWLASAPSVSAGPVSRPAHDRRRQARLPEGPLRHPERGDAGRGRPLEDGRARLPLQRVDPLVPAQRVEQPPGAGHGDLVAEHAVLAGRAAGAQRAQAGHRGGREAGRQRLAGPGQLGQERGRRGMLAQQFPAQAVDHEQAGPAGRGQVQGIGLAGHAQRGEQRRGQVGQGAAAVAGDQGAGPRPALVTLVTLAAVAEEPCPRGSRPPHWSWGAGRRR